MSSPVLCPAFSISSRHSPKVFISPEHSRLESTGCSSSFTPSEDLMSSFNRTKRSGASVSFPRGSHSSKVFISNDHCTPDLDAPGPGTFSLENCTFSHHRSPCHKFSGSSPSNRFISNLHSETNGPKDNPSPCHYSPPSSQKAKPSTNTPCYSIGNRHCPKRFISRAHSQTSSPMHTPASNLDHSVWAPPTKIPSKAKGPSLKGTFSKKVYISKTHCSELLNTESSQCVSLLKTNDIHKSPCFSFGKLNREQRSKVYMGKEYLVPGSQNQLGPGSYEVVSSMGAAAKVKGKK
ncbi:hypothetical protein P9112_002350 [Eukaryota sp. TZLM1-RC]